MKVNKCIVHMLLKKTERNWHKRLVRLFTGSYKKDERIWISRYGFVKSKFTHLLTIENNIICAYIQGSLRSVLLFHPV